MGLRQAAIWLLLSLWWCDTLALNERKHRETLALDERKHHLLSTLMAKVKVQIDAIKTVQEGIQKSLEDIQALGHGHGHGQEAACTGTTYPLDPGSSFVSKDEIVTMNNGHNIRLDDILYGFDWMFESQRLASATSWLGVQSQQNPADMVAIQQVLWDVKPKVIYDIGTAMGGSAIFFAHIMSQYAKPGGAVIVSVGATQFRTDVDNDGEDDGDNDPAAQQSNNCPSCTPASGSPLWSSYVKFLEGGALEAKAVTALEGAIAEHDGPVLISIGGRQQYRGVFKSCNVLGKYVTVGSYVIVQDTNLDRILNKPGPRKAVYDCLAKNTNFVIDKSREVFLYSQHSDGFLLRES